MSWFGDGASEWLAAVGRSRREGLVSLLFGGGGGEMVHVDG